jgi:ATP-binding cassette subfamily F protein uup
MASVLDLRGFRKSYGARVLFDGIDLSLQDGEKVGVIGRNGCGKSTLFRVLSGLEGMDGGTLSIRRGVRVGFLPQDPPWEPTRTALETAAEARPGLLEALNDVDRISAQLETWGDREGIEALLSAQAEATARIEGVSGWGWRARVEEGLTRLGLEDLHRPMSALSGGERRRVALARTLLEEPDLLLLDEPTNHLDAETVLGLEETLFDFPGAVLLVTHDRYFLDRVVDRILEVTPGGLQSYTGGYTEYLEARAEREARLEVEEGKRLALLEKELAWARRSPPARTGKQKARRARAFDEVDKQRERDRTRTREVQMAVSAAPRLGRTILELHEVSKTFPDPAGGEGTTVLKGVSDRLLAGDRIGIVGPNGSGKTTLLRTILGQMPPDSGRVTLGDNTRIGYLDQDRVLDPELTVLRAVSMDDWVEVNGRRTHIRGYLDRFLFPPHVQEQRVGSLSGGERNRVLLARLFLESFNLLVLDEPTNDLDLDTLAVLEDLLEAFEGCLLLVTHDRYLLDKLATSLLVFEGDGKVVRHHGSWDRYLEVREAREAEATSRRREQDRKEREAKAEAGRTQSRDARGDRSSGKLSWQEQKELRGMESRIEGMEQEKASLEEILADPALYQSEEGARTATETTRRYEAVSSELESAYARWMELETRERGEGG